MHFFDRQEEARSQTLRLLLLFVLGGWWLETSALHGGGEKLARRVGAREARPASRESERKLCNIVSELAIAASMKPPQPMVLPREDSINAFAAGWDEDNAVVAVTRGALDGLSRDELQGLVAHEFSPLREGDTRLNMRLAGMVFGLEMIFNLGRSMCEADEHGHRSFLADARAVQFTRSKDGLGGVLRKVAGQQAQGSSPSHSLHPLVQHMLLVSGTTQDRWFATPPPLAERIRRIYGRPMTALSAGRDDEGVTRPDAIF